MAGIAVTADTIEGAEVPDRKLDSLFSWYILGLLTLSYALAYVDRQLLNLLVDPVKRSLMLTDTQLSFVQGAAFIVAYVGAAPFFGRLVDITNRRNILIFGVIAWCLFTVLCGFASNYWELAAARFGVGVSEACVWPVGWSLLPEFFSVRRTPRALSIFTLGGQIGSGFSLLAGGAVVGSAATWRDRIPALNNFETWQIAFVMVGLPGLLVVFLLLSIKEPQRRKTLVGEVTDRAFTMRQCASFLWSRRAFYFRTYLSIGAVAIVFLGIPAWYPTFIMRTIGVAPAQVGFTLGLVTLAAGTTGTLLGPWLARLLEQRGYRDGPLRAAAFSMLGSLAASAAIPFATTLTEALAVGFFVIMFCSLPTGIIAFATQLATPGRMRGIIASIYTLCAQIIGLGIGPSAVALTTDHVFKDPAKVGYSLQMVCGAASLIGFLLLMSNLRHYRAALDADAGVDAA